MPLDCSSSSLNNQTVGITQTTSQQWKNGGMAPLTGQRDGLKPLFWVALIHRRAQPALKRESLGGTDRRLEQVRLEGPISNFCLSPRISLRQRSLHQTQLSSVNGCDGGRIRAAQQSFPRFPSEPPQHCHQNKGGTTCKQLIHGFKAA